MTFYFFSSVILQVSVNGQTFVSSNVTVTALDCKVGLDIFAISILLISRDLSQNLGYVQTIPAHFETVKMRVYQNCNYCSRDTGTVWNHKTFDRSNLVAGSLTKKLDLHGKEIHLGLKSRLALYQKRRKMFRSHCFQVFTRCCFQIVPALCERSLTKTSPH